mmetsp:Transcript_341/g.621  ORF Transcript_341/g.621 Transcript_341/m.621 type:complete len:157 (+) Transcript_341:6-476(+)
MFEERLLSKNMIPGFEEQNGALVARTGFSSIYMPLIGFLVCLILCPFCFLWLCCVGAMFKATTYTFKIYENEVELIVEKIISKKSVQNIYISLDDIKAVYTTRVSGEGETAKNDIYLSLKDGASFEIMVGVPALKANRILQKLRERFNVKESSEIV